MSAAHGEMTGHVPSGYCRICSTSSTMASRRVIVEGMGTPRLTKYALSLWTEYCAGRWLRENAGPDAPTRKVVNISSTMGVHGGATQLAYSAGKAAVVGITKTLAKEWGRFNVTVNAVAFGAIETRLTSPYDREPNISMVKGQPRKVGLSYEQIAAAKQASPLGRLGTPEDAANSIYLMCAPESDWITGEVILASGGVRS